MMISTFQSGDTDGDPSTPHFPEQVPSRDHRASERVAEVAKGSTRVNCELASPGLVDRPD